MASKKTIERMAEQKQLMAAASNAIANILKVTKKGYGRGYDANEVEAAILDQAKTMAAKKARKQAAAGAGARAA